LDLPVCTARLCVALRLVVAPQLACMYMLVQVCVCDALARLCAGPRFSCEQLRACGQSGASCCRSLQLGATRDVRAACVEAAV
jgi:hypothetical protein